MKQTLCNYQYRKRVYFKLNTWFLKSFEWKHEQRYFTNVPSLPHQVRNEDLTKLSKSNCFIFKVGEKLADQNFHLIKVSLINIPAGRINECFSSRFTLQPSRTAKLPTMFVRTFEKYNVRISYFKLFYGHPKKTLINEQKLAYNSVRFFCCIFCNFSTKKAPIFVNFSQFGIIKNDW